MLSPKCQGAHVSRCLFAAFAVTVLLSTSPTAGAAPAQRVRNIDHEVIPESSDPKALGTLNGKLIFGARDAIGSGIWSTDGTAAQTVLLKRLGQNGDVSVSDDFPNFLELNGRGYFIASDGVAGYAVWSTDGTSAGTSMVVDVSTINPYDPQQLRGIVGSRVIFSARDSASVPQMYSTDGTAAGTQPLTTFTNWQAHVEESLIANGKLYFVGRDVSQDQQIWVSDGTLAGTHAINNPFFPNTQPTATPHSFQRVGNLLFYVSYWLPWSIDLATDTIGAVTTATAYAPNHLNHMTAMDNFVLFVGTAENGPTDSMLWRSDGTPAGTFEVDVVNPSSVPYEVVQWDVFERPGNRVVYLGNDDVNGLQLWGSDGSPGNAVRLTSATKPANVFVPVVMPIGTAGGISYFTISDGADTTTWSVWRTDGTVAGTAKISGLPAIETANAVDTSNKATFTRLVSNGTDVFFRFRGAPGSLWKYEPGPGRATALNQNLGISTDPVLHDVLFHDGQRLYFSHHDRIAGRELWVSDGTATGTRLLLDIHQQGSADHGSEPNDLVEFGGRLAFVADDGVSGRELWISDGTDAGTTLLADINPGPGDSNPSQLIVANGALLFFATDGSGQSKFMRLDSAGVLQTLALAEPRPYCSGNSIVALGGNVYFPARKDSSQVVGLWRSGGTPETTGPAPVSVSHEMQCELLASGNRIFYAGWNVGMPQGSPGGYELWSWDGGAAGGAMVADLAPGLDSSWPEGLASSGGLLYFLTRDGTSPLLWKSDGTASGTQLISRLPSPLGIGNGAVHGTLNGKVLVDVFAGSANIPERSLWVSDGTTSGTSLLQEYESYAGADVLVAGGRGYFVARSSEGLEPWVSDGTLAGTRMLKDLNPAGDSRPAWFADFRGVTLIATSDSGQGSQLWRTDGTSASTTLISSIQAAIDPAPAAYTRQRLTVGQKFFFVADDPETGNELYVLTNDLPLAGADSTSSANGAAATVTVLTNDSDADGTLVPQSVRIASNPARGTVTVNSDGAIVYTPTTGSSGTDTFTYTVDDNQGGRSNAAVVTVTVTAPPTVVTTAPRKGGGGSVGAMTLLALLGLFGALQLGRRTRSGALSL